MSKSTSKRATIYFETAIHASLRLKAAQTNQSIADIVNDAVRAALSEDYEDLAAFDERMTDPLMSFEALVKDLKGDDEL